MQLLPYKMCKKLCVFPTILFVTIYFLTCAFIEKIMNLCYLCLLIHTSYVNKNFFKDL